MSKQLRLLYLPASLAHPAGALTLRAQVLVYYRTALWRKHWGVLATPRQGVCVQGGRCEAPSADCCKYAIVCCALKPLSEAPPVAAQAWKPERAHHDSITGRCVLRMDHYCAPRLLQLLPPVVISSCNSDVRARFSWASVRTSKCWHLLSPPWCSCYASCYIVNSCFFPAFGKACAELRVSAMANASVHSEFAARQACGC